MYFSYLQNLRTLDLSFNKLEFISNYIFGEFSKPKLEFLYLNSNNLKDLQFLNQLKSVLYLNLANNSISFFKKEHFKNLIYLDVLILENNPIKHIDSNAFIYNEYLREIYIKNISFSILDVNLNLLIPKEVRILNIAENKFINSKLSNPMKYLEKLTISGLNFSSINLSISELENCREFYSSNTLLDSLDTLIKKIPYPAKITKLVLSFNYISKIILIHFYQMINLEILDLRNNLINFIEKATFRKCINLKNLYLQNNRIKEIYFNIFGWNKLEIFDLRNNSDNISIVTNESLDVLIISVSLDLSYNNMENLNVNLNWKIDLKSLIYYYLNNNRIKELNLDNFINFKDLAWLNLNSNKISFIQNITFRDLVKLEKLELAENELTYLEKETFENLFSLKYLNLSSNFIEYFDKNIFLNLKKLNTLDLCKNNIKLIQNGLFYGLLNLEYLNLAFNKALVILPNSLTGLNSIKRIIFSHDILLNNSNRICNKNSFQPNAGRILNDVIFYDSIFLIYVEDLIDCMLILKFIKYKLLVNMDKAESFDKIWKNCSFYKF